MVKLDFYIKFLWDFYSWYNSRRNRSMILKTFSIVQITTAPYYTRFNGRTEKLVDTFKRSLKKSERNQFLDDILQILQAIQCDTKQVLIQDGTSGDNVREKNTLTQWHSTILNINRYYITQNRKRAKVVSNTKIYFLTAKFHKGRNKNERER